MEFSDLELEESIIEPDEEIMDSAMTKILNRLIEEQEKLLLLALKKGYDGVDVKMDSGVVSDPYELNLGFEYEVWKNEPKLIRPFESNIRRYDFRLLSEVKRRELLNRAENQDLESGGLSL